MVINATQCRSSRRELACSVCTNVPRHKWNYVSGTRFWLDLPSVSQAPLNGLHKQKISSRTSRRLKARKPDGNVPHTVGACQSQYIINDLNNPRIYLGTTVRLGSKSGTYFNAYFANN